MATLVRQTLPSAQFETAGRTSGFSPVRRAEAPAREDFGQAVLTVLLVLYPALASAAAVVAAFWAFGGVLA